MTVLLRFEVNGTKYVDFFEEIKGDKPVIILDWSYCGKTKDVMYVVILQERLNKGVYLAAFDLVEGTSLRKFPIILKKHEEL